MLWERAVGRGHYSFIYLFLPFLPIANDFNEFSVSLLVYVFV